MLAAPLIDWVPRGPCIRHAPSVWCHLGVAHVLLESDADICAISACGMTAFALPMRLHAKAWLVRQGSEAHHRCVEPSSYALQRVFMQRRGWYVKGTGGAVRIALHCVVMQGHGWYIKGLEPSSDAWSPAATPSPCLHAGHSWYIKGPALRLAP